MATTEENFKGHDMTEEPQLQNDQEGDEDSGAEVVEKKWPGWPGENVFRMLVPVQKVGGIIGRKGEFIRRICEESKARIKILDGPPGSKERAVLISGKEESDASIPPAIDGLLRVHKRTVDSLDSDLSNGPPTSGGSITTRLLVPASQAGSLIGKQGSMIKTIQEASNCMIRVLAADDLPAFALQDDRIIEIQGEATGVHGAVEQAACHLRKYLVDRSVIGLFEEQMQLPNSQMEQNMRPHESWGPPSHHGFPPHASGGPPGFGQNSQYMMPPPPRQQDNYYRPPDLPPMEKQLHPGLSVYGRDTSMGLHSSNNGQPPQSMGAQTTQHMQVPLSFADAVIGTAGATISYIRRVSSATITIQETRGVPAEMTVEINGTALQVQTAQQLIKNYMAEAAGSVPAQNPGPMDNSYSQSHNAINYSEPPANTGYPGPPPAGGGYGNQPPARGGYGSQPAGGSYGTQPTGGGSYGSQPPAGGGYGTGFRTNNYGSNYRY